MGIEEDVKTLLIDGVDPFWAMRHAELLRRLYEAYGLVRMYDGITQAEGKEWLESFD